MLYTGRTLLAACVGIFLLGNNFHVDAELATSESKRFQRLLCVACVPGSKHDRETLVSTAALPVLYGHETLCAMDFVYFEIRSAAGPESRHFAMCTVLTRRRTLLPHWSQIRLSSWAGTAKAR